ncbi:hypothetical protein PanWU01x14_204820 [Parasponia andersonii]|uniref:Uncharacterized protein n=1 Tax=Parasponia andersonii TaxID=3476 RepID=A0A2P5BWD2_PARAD|nr:hypothetical protein PanWU01x14_204820 [Parasponia andersonii]
MVPMDNISSVTEVLNKGFGVQWIINYTAHSRSSSVELDDKTSNDISYKHVAAGICSTAIIAIMTCCLRSKSK